MALIVPMEREYLLTVLSLCRQVVSLWTCSKLCTFFFVAGVFVGYTLKRRVRSWASKLLRKLRDDWYCPVSHLYIFPNLMLLLRLPLVVRRISQQGSLLHWYTKSVIYWLHLCSDLTLEYSSQCRYIWWHVIYTLGYNN